MFCFNEIGQFQKAAGTLTKLNRIT